MIHHFQVAHESDDAWATQNGAGETQLFRNLWNSVSTPEKDE